eukprot:31066-Pelagococcus_subviridis.AAC.1
MRHPHRRHLLSVHHPSHRLHDVHLIRLVQKRRELVQEHHPRVLHEHARDRDALLLPPRERRDLFIQPLVALQIHRRERGADSVHHLLRGQIRALDAQTERDVRADGGHDDLVVRVLEHERLRRRDAQAAAPRLGEARERSKQRGLAAAVRAQEHVERASRDAERRAAERVLRRRGRVLRRGVSDVQVFHLRSREEGSEGGSTEATRTTRTTGGVRGRDATRRDDARAHLDAVRVLFSPPLALRAAGRGRAFGGLGRGRARRAPATAMSARRRAGRASRCDADADADAG